MRYLFLYILIYLICMKVYCDEKVDLEKAVKELASENQDMKSKAKRALDLAGLRAIPELRKLLNSTDPDIKAYAERKVLGRFSYKWDPFKPEKVLGTDSNIGSCEKFRNEYYEFLNSFLLKSYERNSLKIAKWNSQIKLFIPMWVEYFKNLEVDTEQVVDYQKGKSFRTNEMDLRKALNELADLGCGDPFFIYLKQTLYFSWNDFRFSLVELTKSADLMTKSNYSNYFRFNSALKAMALTPATYSKTNEKEKNPLAPEVFQILIEMGKEDTFKIPIGQRRHYQWLNEVINELEVEQVEIHLKDIGEIFGKDSWMYHMIVGKYHIKNAWFLGYGGKSKQYTKEGEKLFFENMEEAKKHSLEALKLQAESVETLVQLINETLAVSGDVRVRLWFEKAFKLEGNNIRVFNAYISTLSPDWNGSPEQMMILGNEYLAVNIPKLYTGKFYMSALQNAMKNNYKNFDKIELINNLEWAVEQQASLKPIHAPLYYNDLAIKAFEAKDYKKCLKAIQSTQGLFSASWLEGRILSTNIEKFIMMTEKYKNTKVASSLIEAYSERPASSIYAVFQLLNKEIEPIDQPKIVNLLMNLNKDDVNEAQGAEDRILEIQNNFGYKEKALVNYMRKKEGYFSEKGKTKFKAQYGDKTIEALDLMVKTNLALGIVSREELAKNIKEIFMKNLNKESELDEIVEYNKSQIRAYLKPGRTFFYEDEFIQVISPYVKNIKNQHDRADFLSVHLNERIKDPYSKFLAKLLKNNFINFQEDNFSLIEKELKRISSIEGNLKLIEEVKKIWLTDGDALMDLAMVNLLRQRNLHKEAELLYNWLLYCMESYYKCGDPEAVVQLFSIYPNFNKEAYQFGALYLKSKECRSTSFLLAYHVFKLGQFHLAYESLCEAQTYVDHCESVVLNNKRFKKSDDLLKYIVDEMLMEKGLPDYIRFNLKDQFDVKFKK